MQLGLVRNDLPGGAAAEDADRGADAALEVGERLERPHQRRDRRERRGAQRARRADMRGDALRADVQRADRAPADHELAAGPARFEREAGIRLARMALDPGAAARAAD